jgi:hypothetical protein
MARTPQPIYLDYNASRLARSDDSDRWNPDRAPCVRQRIAHDSLAAGVVDATALCPACG